MFRKLDESERGLMVLNKMKQDHLRWRCSTVIHWEQLVYLAIWKDLNKGKI